MPRLLIASGSALFLELACIRWAGSHVLYLSYVSNLVLIAAFLGLGLGALLAASTAPKTIERWISSAPWWLLVLLVVVLMSELEVQIDGPQAVYFRNAQGSNPLPAWLVLPLLGGLITTLFVSLGFAVGRELSASPPLVAYSVDIAGSLAGIILFGLVSFVGLPAHYWFLAVMVALIAIMPARRTVLASTVLATVAILAVVSWADSGSYWSPYQRVSVLELKPAAARAPNDPAEGSAAYRLRVNNIVHQYIRDVRTREPFYEFPFRAAGAKLPGAGSPYLTATPPYSDWSYDPFTPRKDAWGGRVAIIGAGNGTDTAVALAYGASHVDAVEIDPLLADIGRELQPNHPYRDPRTTVHVMDGRTFLERAASSAQRYDVIVFGLPDSVTLASPYAGVRLESFLFTEQAFASALQSLHPEHGLLVAYNYYRTRWLVDRIAGTLARATGSTPRVWLGPDKNLSAVFMAGPGAAKVDAGLGDDWKFTPAVAIEDVGHAEDDWPFLYLRERAIPSHIQLSLVISIALGALSIVLALRHANKVARRNAGRGGPSLLQLAPFFFMGAAFLLLETSGLVRMSLLFGVTWLVNALVFAAVLGMVLIANLLAARLPANADRAVSLLLVASLALAFLVPPAAFSAWDAVPKYIASTALLFVPVLLGNLRFSLAFRDSAWPAQAFGANLLGAVVGGALENLALVWGYRALFLVACALYLFAIWSRRSDKPALTA